MNRVLRVAALAAFLLGLSGCNVVFSEDPWFTAADATPTPVLRDGLWLYAEPDCRFDEARPAERWPNCAGASFVRGKERWSMRWDDTDARGRSRRTFAGWESDDDPISDGLLVANGDHLILQFQSEGESDASPSDKVGEGAGEAESQSYKYGVLRPVRFDDEGRVEAFETWAVQCGPISEPERSSAERRRLRDNPDFAEEPNYVTDAPFPGLKIVEDNCIAESAEAVRNAAVRSEALQSPTQMRWIREGWR
jgi:hypothetical protein